MAWDFATDDEWAAQLAWVTDFVRAECEPLDLIIKESHDLNDPVRQALIPPLQKIVKERGLWAAHLGPHLGGPGYGQVKLALTKKDGTCVITGIGKALERTADVGLFGLAMMNQQIKGTIYGSGSPRVEIPRLLDLYRSGILKLDEMVTRTYSLDDINVGYADMHSGANIRGVITF